MESAFERGMEASEVDLDHDKLAGGLLSDIPCQQRSAHERIRKPAEQRIHEGIRPFTLLSQAARPVPAKRQVGNNLIFKTVDAVLGRDGDALLNDVWLVQQQARSGRRGALKSVQNSRSIVI